MTTIAMTGAGGFLGFHLRAAALDYGIQTVSIPLGNAFDLDQAQAAMEATDAVIHLAAVNRGTDEEVTAGNILFANQLAATLEGLQQPPTRIVYANSIQIITGTNYGAAKYQAAEILAATAQTLGLRFENIVLPNLFGEYGRPFYNSVVATFSHLIATGQPAEIQQDRELQLLHAQHAADVLLGYTPVDKMVALSQWESVSGIKDLLEEFAEVYAHGEIPDLATAFRRDLFNTYRSYTFPAHTPIAIQRHADHRGDFFEILRSHGGTGQTSFSTTAPGITRGDHYHRRKVERFTVLAGEAEIKLRRLFDDQVFTYRVSGNEPLSVDMPTLYTHSISNVGTGMLYTAFWTNDIFDPEQPDTITEPVTCTSSLKL
ncbi:polysaccharide biosynthesis C-terminal domain-containing protein [Yaniella halotolerans]|uniref:polysaccharide biosynthesis C-terminal domain-containing protein n=1 Tax=Yaniella halotolerans TaxID=225453 RepID=UPI0003B79F01|nr:NAD-dependent epimerase/dehydratase family protein [Yaniella halotolerans]